MEIPGPVKTLSDDERTRLVDEPINFALNLIEEKKQQLFSELIRLGYQESDMDSLINMWNPEKFRTEDVYKEMKILTDVHLAASAIISFEYLWKAAKQRTVKECLDFKYSALNLCVLLIGICQTTLFDDNKDSRNEFRDILKGAFERIERAEEIVKQEMIEKARTKKKANSDQKHKSIRQYWKQIKKKDPSISKNLAARIIYDNRDKNEGLAESTIRKLLRNA